MKRLFSILLSAALLLSCLTACGGGGGSSGGGNASTGGSSVSSGGGASSSTGSGSTSSGSSSSSPSAPAGSSTSGSDLPALSGGFESPVLITSAGRSADDVIVQTLCTKANITTDLKSDATSADLEGVKTLILAVGGSSKGLGAAGIDADAELARVKELISAAQSAGIKIVAMHVGGAARRGDLSDKFIADPFNAADAAIVVSGGDADGMIRGILSQNGTPSSFVDGQVDCIDGLTTLFG